MDKDSVTPRGTSAAGSRSVCPVVLAGGLSSRMGRDKALLKLPYGETLLARARNLLTTLPPPAGVEFMPVLVSGARPGGVPDRVPEVGPLGGLQAIARHLQEEGRDCDALLVIPVDMPLLGRGELRTLCAAGQSVEQAVCFGDFYLPAWLPLNARTRRYLDAAVVGDAIASIRALYGFLGCMQLPVPQGDWHLNANQPDDFIRIARLARGETSEK